MNVSTSVRASALSAAARTDGHCGRHQIDQQLDRGRIAQLRQRGDRLELQVLIDASAT